MGQITSARAYANNEVAYVAWDIDEKIEGCLGFEVTRVYLKEDGETVIRRADGSEDRVRCAAWVSFSGQSNPHWIPQDTGIWPVQKLSWRDLTLRKRRNELRRRGKDTIVRYEIRAVGDFETGMEAAPDPIPKMVEVVTRDADGRPIKDAEGRVVKETVKSYEGKPRKLGYLGAAVATGPIVVSLRRGIFQSAFTNGILAAQWLKNVLLEDDGVISPGELFDKISNPNDPHRKYLAGDVLPMLRNLLLEEGEFFIALYELDDEELVKLVVEHGSKISLILANTSAEEGVWDKRNSAARERLIEANVKIQHRMFNSSGHIGHNKFIVHHPANGGTPKVLTGSTNWTTTGVAGQTNNMLLIESHDLAKAFMGYWQRMHDDALDVPDPFGAPTSGVHQSAAFRASNEEPVVIQEGGVEMQVWFSPNMQRVSKGTKRPPDLAEVFRRMRMAKDAILFLAFYPSQTGTDSIVGEAIDIGVHDGKLIVTGAVSSAQAMPNYVPKKKNDPDDEDDDVAAISPHTFSEGNVSIVRAAAIDDRAILGDFGGEQLTAKGKIGAIIHDKVVVIDPLSPDCTVILGSHNLGYKASYCNDENLLIISGDRGLAEAYAVHIMDVYDHYRFRAIEAELKKKHKKGWSGYLDTDDSWLEAYADREKGALMRYFAEGRRG